MPATSPLLTSASWRRCWVLTKALSPLAAAALYQGSKKTENADGDDHEWASPAPREPRGGLGEAQRSRGAQELYPRQRAARQDFGQRISGCRHRQGRSG